MKRNQEQDAQAQLQMSDLEQRSLEYHAEGDRIRDVLKRVGLTSDALSKSGIQSLQSLSAACVSLDSKNTSKSHLMIAAGHRNRDVLDTRESLAHAEQELYKISAQIKIALTRKAALDRLLADLDAVEQEQIPIINKKKQDANVYKRKCQEYQKQIKQLDTQLKSSFIGQKAVKHDKLQLQAEYLTGLKDELKPLRNKLDIYHNLPADLTLTKVKVEEAKLRLHKMEQQLDQNINLLGL